MITISLCMIVKNEEDTLGRCLESVKDIVDEIVIVDTGSTDKTREIAKRYTKKVFNFKWIDDFSAARNYSFSKATKDYILWLDADDVILEDDALKFKDLKESLKAEIDIVMMKYNVGFDANGNVTLSYFRERLSKRSKNFQWVEPIHEYLQMSGTIINVDICVTHRKEHATAAGRNLKIFEKFISQEKELSPRSVYYYARELYYNGRYEEAVSYFNKFLDEGKGWIEDNISACFTLSKCFHYLKEEKSRLKALLRSFEYDLPRGEICSEIGYCYKDSNDFQKAIFWFELALTLKKPQNSWGFILHDYWNYIPMMELCVCYNKIGNIAEAIKFNEMAALVKPNDPAVEYNKKYFSSLGTGTGQ